ncbi:hypothetical protein Cgig2_026860 [Carnegiea gigantea]|uniref:Ubiquitin-like protease family profile domain-containing protein n=1 Tax=Carnegiea gigantea TaxID=171969 RepID=A0A9Q1QRK9_9CARY|nr:hypothetical protein Cgig2_026860 [Carnegiea gigantea]
MQTMWVHDSPFTGPTHLPGAQKSKKEMKDGVTSADEPPAVDDPSEGSVDPPILDVQPLSVEGLGIGPSVEKLNKMKLTKEVLAGYTSAPLSAREMELVTKVEGRTPQRQTVRGGHPQVSAKARAGKLVTGPHPRGDLAQQEVYLGRHIGYLESHPLAGRAMCSCPCLIQLTGTSSCLLRTYESVPFLCTIRCPVQQPRPGGNYRHDCGVFVMAFMKLLSLKANGFEFDQDCVLHYRDKCLLSFL